jgi:hypothetical protein
LERQVFEQVQRVDRRALGAVKTRGVEGDGFVVALGRDVDDAPSRGDLLDRAAGRLDGQIELEGSWREPAGAVGALLERHIGGKAVLHVD